MRCRLKVSQVGGGLTEKQDGFTHPVGIPSLHGLMHLSGAP